MTTFPDNTLTEIDKVKCLAIAAELSDEKVEVFRKLFHKVDKQQLLEEAIEDEVASHLVSRLQDLVIDYPSAWDIHHKEVQLRISNLMSELEKVASHLATWNINVVGLKNAGIARGIYKNNACSPMGDIDLLVGSNDFHDAHQILVKDLGYTFKFRSDLENEDLQEAFKGGGTEYFKEVGGYKVWLELQWRPVAGRWIQPHNEPNGDELLRRSVAIEDSNLRILSPVDNLLQVCLHTAKHSYCRAPGFRLHTDVDRIVRYQEIDWDSFTREVKKLNLKTAVYYSLFLAKELLYTPIPKIVIESLKPNRIRRNFIEDKLRKAGLTGQHKSKFTKKDYILFNLALYDNLGEMSTAILPSIETMKKRYEFENSFLLPYYHTKRLFALITKRAKL